MSPSDHPFRYVGKIERSYFFSPGDPLPSLMRVIEGTKPDVLVPCDDAAVFLLHNLHEQVSGLRGLIERSLGDPSGFEVVRSRDNLMLLADRLGICTPESTGLQSEAALRDWFAQHGEHQVLKRDGTFGGKGVAVVHSLEEAQRAYRWISKPRSALVRGARWLALGEPLNLFSARQPSSLIVQRYIHGHPANTLFVCREGQILASVTVEVLSTEGKTGAALLVRRIHNAEIHRASASIARSLKLSGFHGLDFILERATGRAYLLEINPRCTQLGHLPMKDQGDLAAYLDNDNGSQVGAEHCVDDELIAFFPQSLWSLSVPAQGSAMFIDIPWDAPQLTRELMRSDWRERSLLGWLYYHLFPTKREAVSWLPTEVASVVSDISVASHPASKSF